MKNSNKDFALKQVPHLIL